MNERTPNDLWERMRRAVEGWIQPDGDVDEMALAFHIAYVAPLLLALAFLLRR